MPFSSHLIKGICCQRDSSDFSNVKLLFFPSFHITLFERKSLCMVHTKGMESYDPLHWDWSITWIIWNSSTWETCLFFFFFNLLIDLFNFCILIANYSYITCWNHYLLTIGFPLHLCKKMSVVYIYMGLFLGSLIHKYAFRNITALY